MLSNNLIETQCGLVGIAMATHNPCLSYFIDQISSIKNQTYQNWKCIIVDDNSTDEKYKNIQQIIGSDPRFEIHRNLQNLGSFKTFERALMLLPREADYICFCDQDDVWISSKLEIQINIFQDSNVMLVHTDQSLIDGKGRVFVASCWELEGRDALKATTDMMLFRNLITGCTTMFRKQVLRTALPFYPLRNKKEMYHHDMWIAMHACIHGKIVGLKEPLVHYRQHGGNLVGVSSLRKPLRVRGLIQRAHLAFIERLGFRKDFLDSLSRVHQVNQSEIYATQSSILSYLDNPLRLFIKGLGYIWHYPLLFRTWVMLGVGLMTFKCRSLLRFLARKYFYYLKQVPRAQLAQKYLSGEGIEIGALHSPVIVPRSVKVKYVDRIDAIQLRTEYPDLTEYTIVAPDIIDDGESLSKISSSTLSFIIANHFIEHCEDPISTLMNFSDKLKEDGIIYLAVPDKMKTFDRQRHSTTMEHLFDDHEHGPRESRKAHYIEYIENIHSKGRMTKEQIEVLAQDLMGKNYRIHFHVWTGPEFESFLASMIARYNLPLKILTRKPIHDECVFILKKVNLNG